MKSAYRIAAENLALWQTAAAENRELRLLQALQLGYEKGEQWRAGATQNSADLATPVHALPTPTLVSPPDQFAQFMSMEEQLFFCKGFLQAFPYPLREEEPPLPPPPAAPRVVFLESAFAREALHAFQRIIPHARPITAPSFFAVCEELASDRADFALLPLQDSEEGRLAKLCEEIDRFELRVTHSCEIPYPEQGRAVTMALVAKRYAPASPTEGERLLSCTVLEEDGQTLPDILNAALCCGLTLRGIDARPAPYGENGLLYFPVFRSDKGEERLFEAYLTIRHPRAHVTGTHIHLTQKKIQR